MSEEVKKRGRPKGSKDRVKRVSRPRITEPRITPEMSKYGQEFIEPGDNKRFIAFAMESRRLPKLNFDSNEEIQERIDWYFTRCAEYDMKPGVVGLANAIGIDRKTIWAWKTGERRGDQRGLSEIIKNAYSFIEEMWEMYMLNGKINPPNGIFIGKNNFGYTDVQQVVVQPSNPYDEANPGDVRNKYIEGVQNEILTDGTVE